MGIQLSPEASVEDVLEGKLSFEAHQEQFTPQQTAFRDHFAQGLLER